MRDEFEPHREALVGGYPHGDDDEDDPEPHVCPDCGSTDVRHELTLGWTCLECEMKDVTG